MVHVLLKRLYLTLRDKLLSCMAVMTATAPVHVLGLVVAQEILHGANNFLLEA